MVRKKASKTPSAPSGSLPCPCSACKGCGVFKRADGTARICLRCLGTRTELTPPPTYQIHNVPWPFNGLPFDLTPQELELHNIFDECCCQTIDSPTARKTINWCGKQNAELSHGALAPLRSASGSSRLPTTPEE